MLVVLLVVEVAAPVQHHHVQVQVALLLLLLLKVLMLDAAAFSPSSLVVSLRLSECSLLPIQMISVIYFCDFRDVLPSRQHRNIVRAMY